MQKKYKGILHISLEISKEEFSIAQPFKERLAKDIERLVVHNAGGIQPDGSFDLDCESPRISLSGTLSVVDRIKTVICEIDPEIEREKLDITIWIHIPEFYSEANAKPAIMTSLEHPKGVACTIRDWSGELSKDQRYFGECPSPVSDVDDLESVTIDQIEFV